MKKLVMMVVVISLLSGGCAINSEYGRQYRMKRDAELAVKKTTEAWQWKNRYRLDKKRREFLERANEKSEQMDKQRKEFAKEMYEQTKLGSK